MKINRLESFGCHISFREWAVCFFTAFTLVFSAWSFGGNQLWGLHLMSLGGLFSFLLSVIPMPRICNGDDLKHGNLKNLKRLILLPFFWISLFFLLYILIQNFNPSYIQVLGEKSWWVESVRPPLGENFPTSVKSSYESMNAMRVFEFKLLLCWHRILVGIKTRKTALIILNALFFLGLLSQLSRYPRSSQVLIKYYGALSLLTLLGYIFLRNQAATANFVSYDNRIALFFKFKRS